MSRRNELGARKKSLQTRVQPVNQVVSVAEVKNSLRIDATVTDDDALILALIKSATKAIECFYGISLITKQQTLFMDDLPFRKISDPLYSNSTDDNLSTVRATESTINLLTYPVKSIEFFYYYNDLNTQATWPATSYILDPGSKTSRLLKKPASTWPIEIFRPGSALEIQLTSGFGDDATDVPDEIRQAVQRYAEHLYMTRGCDDAGGLPGSIKALMICWARVRI